MRIFSQTILAVLVLGLVSAGCGSDDEATPSSDREAIQGVVDNYETATRDGDAALFCDEVVVAGAIPDCEQVIAKAMDDPESDLSSEDKVEVLRIDVKGDSAEVRAEVDGKRRLVDFFKQDGEWRMEFSTD